MRRTILAALAAAAAAALAGCADATTAPNAAKQAASTKAASMDITCRSGYIVAYDENGNPYCAPVQTGTMRREP